MALPFSRLYVPDHRFGPELKEEALLKPELRTSWCASHGVIYTGRNKRKEQIELTFNNDYLTINRTHGLQLTIPWYHIVGIKAYWQKPDKIRFTLSDKVNFRTYPLAEFSVDRISIKLHLDQRYEFLANLTGHHLLEPPMETTFKAIYWIPVALKSKPQVNSSVRSVLSSQEKKNSPLMQFEDGPEED